MIKKYDKVMMATAFIWAEESYCKRAKVGAILSSEGRIVSNGYNGTISGSKNCCEDKLGEEMHCGRCGEKNQDKLSYGNNFCKTCNYTGVVSQSEILVSKNTVVHAEANALMFAAKSGINTQGCTMYVTLSPCIECSKMMFQAGIKRVVYSTDYRISDGIDFLKEHGMEVIKLENKWSN